MTLSPPRRKLSFLPPSREGMIMTADCLVVLLEFGIGYILHDTDMKRTHSPVMRRRKDHGFVLLLGANRKEHLFVMLGKLNKAIDLKEVLSFITTSFIPLISEHPIKSTHVPFTWLYSRGLEEVQRLRKLYTWGEWLLSLVLVFSWDWEILLYFCTFPVCYNSDMLTWAQELIFQLQIYLCQKHESLSPSHLFLDFVCSSEGKVISFHLL